MRISVLGTGYMGKALTRTLAAHFETITWGSRAPMEAAKLVEQLQLDNVVASSYEDAINADILIPALKFSNLLHWAKSNNERLKGKTIIDISNPFNENYADFTVPWGESASEKLQSVVPQSNVVGAFKNTFFKVFDEPAFLGQISDVLVTGDDEAARSNVIALLELLPFRFIDAGRLANNRTIERFTLLELEIANRYNTYPYISVSIFGLKAVKGAENA